MSEFEYGENHVEAEAGGDKKQDVLRPLDKGAEQLRKSRIIEANYFLTKFPKDSQQYKDLAGQINDYAFGHPDTELGQIATNALCTTLRGLRMLDKARKLGNGPALTPDSPTIAPQPAAEQKNAIAKNEPSPLTEAQIAERLAAVKEEVKQAQAAVDRIKGDQEMAVNRSYAAFSLGSISNLDEEMKIAQTNLRLANGALARAEKTADAAKVKLAVSNNEKDTKPKT